MSTVSTFVAVWPIHDQTLGARELRLLAEDDLPRLVAQAHARLVGPGSWSVRLSVDVPGSGRASTHVLHYEAPAVEIDRRRYWKGDAA